MSRLIVAGEADALRAGIELGEDEMVQCLQAYEKNKVLVVAVWIHPQFRDVRVCACHVRAFLNFGWR
jgi:hypothetical protein